MTTTAATISQTEQVTRIEITHPRQRQVFVPRLFATPFGEQMVQSFLDRHSNYEGGMWQFWEVPRGISGHVGPYTDIITTRPTGYMTPPEGTYQLSIPGNYFDEEVSADAAGIIATLFVLNQLCWKTSEMGPQYAQTCQGMVDRQDALKDYVSIIEHPERSKIFRAID
ncbi:antirestriction protein [Serratia fonticola]|uniref:antirestriction protein n=1 Tax=Serratia fonticola TaxID=47917 RepID=UPI001AE56744|nr:antirestriction protein [Serratia fonticola]MBP1000320.1 antirestriction protein [Serratia fonticola]MBP1005283.1 antirestriction protein [Serratia fonticola]MBP1014937.1 antirestriction protein [Serratia fonticola]QXN65132.1 antirestriction protein [Serratia fonticola]